MAFWWVNHKQTRATEVTGDFLWSPRTKKNGNYNQPYQNMTLAEVGDIVFSYANGRILHAGVVSERASPSQKPDFDVATPWANDGWLLPVVFSELRFPIVPKDHLDVIVPLLAGKHAPIQPNGRGNQAVYLAAITHDLGSFLLEIGQPDLAIPEAIASSEDLLADLEKVKNDEFASQTDRIQLSKARIGQGVFRRRVLQTEPSCRLTGVTSESFLRASHIKPWRECSNRERLDGSNGLMLAPHVDLLFDRHLLSFRDDGTLLISKKLDANILDKWNVKEPAISRAFTERQCAYLEMHRSKLP